MFKKLKKKFTLVELIIVIVIIALLAGLAMPKFIGVQRDAQVASLYRDIDVLETIIPVYYNETDEYPIVVPDDGQAIKLTDGSDLQNAILSTGDSGTQLYKIDLTKTAKYTTKLKHGYSNAIDDYFIYSKESGQVFYAAGITNGNGELVYGQFSNAIRNVVLGDIPLSKDSETPMYSGNYIMTGEVIQNETISLSFNGTDIPVTYGSVSFGGINIYAGSNDYKTFFANITIADDTDNIITIKTVSQNMVYKIITIPNLNQAPVAVITMTPSQGITTETTITWGYLSSTDPDGDTIVNSEWQGKQNIYSTEGTYTVQLRVQDSKGMWSEWASTLFYVVNSKSVIQVEAGDDFTVALMNDGTVKTWGWNVYGQLGNGTTTDSLTPVTVTGLSGVKQITAGYAFTVVLMTDGTVKAWGKNDYGQLGDGTTTTRLIPVTVTGLSEIKQVGAGNYHSLAIMADGTVKAWGDNRFGQLGDGTTTKRLIPVTVTGLSGVSQVFAGGGNSVAIMNDGTVKAWGWNANGQLGDGTTIQRLTSVTVTGLSGVKQVAVGSDFAVALMNDGTVKAWGWNIYSQLGDGTTIQRNTPVTVTGLSGVKEVAVGNYHTVALMNDGTVKAWGYNVYGQLGDGTTAYRSIPVTVTGLSGVKQVAAGVYHSLALMNDGSVKAWGYNGGGQLGDGTTTNRNTPVSVVGLNN